MSQSFAQKLAVGGKTNSLGLADEVVQEVLKDKARINELYNCLFESDDWLRMRAADSLEKVCRVHPEWFEPYVDRILKEMGKSTQPSLQWHAAQMLGEVTLTSRQQQEAVWWLKERLVEENTDWIVAANVMSTLMQFTKVGFIPKAETKTLIEAQRHHRSQSVRKRAIKLLAELEKLS